MACCTYSAASLTSLESSLAFTEILCSLVEILHDLPEIHGLLGILFGLVGILLGLAAIFLCDSREHRTYPKPCDSIITWTFCCDLDRRKNRSLLRTLSHRAKTSPSSLLLSRLKHSTDGTGRSTTARKKLKLEYYFS